MYKEIDHQQINFTQTGGTKKKYILWVRHCESCANKSTIFNPMRKSIREPLCTEKGIAQSFIFGKQLKTLSHDFNIYCSVLPRAMETAKLISCGLGISSKQILRTNYCQETKSWYETDAFAKFGTTNLTNLEKSNCHATAINKFIICGSKVNDNTILGYKNNKYFTESNYNKWKKEILPKLHDNVINIVVVHGRFLRKQVLKDIGGVKIKFANLEGVLLEYCDLNVKLIKEYRNISINDINLNIEKLYNPLMKRMANCSYTFHKDILPLCSKI